MISEFKDMYRWLSNFTPVVVLLDGMEYPSTENAYQAAKTLDINEREVIRDASEYVAKRLGRNVTMRDDWDEVKLGIMEDLNRQKYAYPYFAALLLNTGDQEIVEGNWWHDNYWGMCTCARCLDKGTGGQNHLGKIIMKIRAELRANEPDLQREKEIEDAKDIHEEELAFIYDDHGQGHPDPAD